MIIEGLNLIRDFWSGLNDEAKIGTGTNQETAQDTDLQTAISGSESTDITNTTEDQFIKKEVIFPSTSAGDESVTEMIWKNSSSDTAGSRNVFSAATWESDSDLKIETRWFFGGRR